MASDGKSVSSETLLFLNNTTAILKTASVDDQLFRSAEGSLQALQILCTFVLHDCSTRYSQFLLENKGSGSDSESLWGEFVMEAIECSEIHSNLFWLSSFIQGIQPHKAGLPILDDLANLWALRSVLKFAATFVGFNLLKREQVAMLRRTWSRYCKELRVQAVVLVDAFDIPDFILKAPFGRKDGDVYNNYWRVVNDAPNSQGQPEYWEELIKPLVFDECG